MRWEDATPARQEDTMKIAFVGLRGIPTSYGGIERHVEELATRLVARGHEVTVYCMSRYTNTADYKGVKLIRLPAIKEKHLEMMSYSLLATLHLFFFGRADVVHFQSVEVVALALPLRVRSAIVATSHGPAYRRLEKWGGLARGLMQLLELGFVYLPHARIVIASFLQKFYAERSGCEVSFIPNGVSVREVEGDRALARFGLQAGNYVLYVGRLVASKGCHVLIDAYQRIRARQDLNWKLVIVGDITQADEYVTSLVKECSDDVLFTGYLSGDELWQLYAHSAVFVFPSTVESLPMVLLEAMSFGTPVVYADVEENRLVAGTLAYSFRPNDAEDLAHRLMYILGHESEARALAFRARQTVRADYDWDKVVDQTEKVYASVVGRRARAGQEGVLLEP